MGLQQSLLSQTGLSHPERLHKTEHRFSEGNAARGDSFQISRVCRSRN